MATIGSASLSPRLSAPAHHGGGQAKPFAGFGAIWRHFFERAFNPYRPELHYMRGPGPAWRAKHAAISPAVQSMVSEIRATRSRRRR